VLFASYAAWPVVSFWPQVADPKFALFFLRQVDLIMYYTVLLAAPVVMLTFLTDLGLGLINRFAPQLNVFFLAMPIKSGLAIFVLVIYFTTLMDQFSNRFVIIHKLIHILGKGIA
jgi:type III secretion protein T